MAAPHSSKLERLSSESAKERHKQMVDSYKERPSETNAEALQRGWSLLPEEEKKADKSVESKLAKSLWNRLDKERAVIDLSRLGTHGIGVRWRTPREVERSKGERVCAERSCSSVRELQELEVPFEYVESGKTKRALVRVCLCSKHADITHSSSSSGTNQSRLCSSTAPEERERWSEKRRRGRDGDNGERSKRCTKEKRHRR